MWNAFLSAAPADRAGLLAQIQPADLGAILREMPVADRRKGLGALTQEELASVLGKAPVDVLVALLASDFLDAEPTERLMLIRALGEARLAELILAMGVSGRRDALARLGKDDLAFILARLAQKTLVLLGRQSVAALGSYRARLTKVERLRGKLSDAQTIEVAIRPEPFAFRLEFKAGPATGRRVLYNAEIRRDEVRIKEGGMLGFAGAMWLNLDNPLTRMDTNHRATEVGFASLLDLIDADMKAAAAAGIEHLRKDEGFDASGAFASVFSAPPGATGLYAVSTRIGFDVASSLPTRVEVTDREGLLETYRWDSVARADLAPDFFSLKAAGL